MTAYMGYSVHICVRAAYYIYCYCYMHGIILKIIQTIQTTKLQTCFIAH